MIVQKIRLTKFRNFKSKLFKFSPKITVIVGPNASGKTNILEALFLLSTGKSFHARVEEEMIAYRSELSRIKGRILVDGGRTDLEVVLTRGEIAIGGGSQKSQKAPKKKLLVSGVPRRLFNFAGNFKVVLFGPWDLELVTESPSVRRKFLDSVLSQVDSEYRRASLSYEKGLRQRNRLLYRIREDPSAGHSTLRDDPSGSDSKSSEQGGGSRSQLMFWDRLLIKNGDYLSSKRAEFIDFINLSPKINKEEFSLDYDSSAISEARLEQYAQEEIAAATTLVGPHRDDFCFRLKKNRKARDLARYGSRGEHRMGVLWLKLAELKFIEETPLRRAAGLAFGDARQGYEGQGKPILLLDDIFSELDHEHREIVMKVIGNQQTIITTADPHFVEGLKSVDTVKLKG